MEFTITSKDQCRHVYLREQFTFSDNQQFKQLVTLVKEEELQGIELYFNEVTFIDSAGLGMLLLLRDECQKKNVVISINGAQGQVRNIFMISKFDQLFSMVG